MSTYGSAAAGAFEAQKHADEMALRSRQQVSYERGQEFNQARVMSLDNDQRRQRTLDNRRIDQASRTAEDERAFVRERALRADETVANERAFARGMTERNSMLAERRFALDAEREAARQSDAAFDQMVKRDEYERNRLLFERQEEQYAALQRQKEGAQEATKASFASLLSNTVRYGDRDEQGNIFAPAQFLDVFKKSQGNGGAGIAALQILHKDGRTGKDLSFPQILVYGQVADPNGKLALGAPEVMNASQLKTLFTAYPGAQGAFAELYGNASNAWMETLGMSRKPESAAGGVSERDYAAFLRENRESARKNLESARAQSIPDKAAIAGLEGRLKAAQAALDKHYGYNESAEAVPISSPAMEKTEAIDDWVPPPEDEVEVQMRNGRRIRR